MSKKSIRPQSRRHILIYDEDWDWLMQHFGAGSLHPIGVGPAIRAIIHKHVRDLQARAQVRMEPQALAREPEDELESAQ